jgi:mannose-1-phosphate guanylyltransferase/phosphomannomutase
MPAMPIVHEEVATPGEQKGLIMRTLMERLAEQDADLVLVDGIKVQTEDGWVLVVPDPEDPVTHVWAEGSDLPGSVALATSYVERISGLSDTRGVPPTTQHRRRVRSRSGMVAPHEHPR